MHVIKKLLVENRGFILFMVGMILFRSALADWYVVPSGSMYPTVMIGDRIIANRIAYDLKLPFTDIVLEHVADPKRGDIVTFASPVDGTRLVKRLIGVPGDRVELRDEILYLNGVSAAYATAVGGVARQHAPDYSGLQVVLNETTPDSRRPIMLMPERDGILRSFGPVLIPAGQYLMLGDNRDNSQDSRYIGMVRRDLITGRVSWVAFSLDTDHFYMPRLARFGASLIAR